MEDEKKIPLGIDQHKELGQQLHHFRNFAVGLTAFLKTHYSESSNAVKCAIELGVSIDKLREALDRQLTEDHRRLEHVYYPVESKLPKPSVGERVRDGLTGVNETRRKGSN